MPFPLSSADYDSFIQAVNPDVLGLPDWGGIAQWNGRYVLMFKMPSGDWALSDVTGGIPYGSTTISIADYVKNVPSYQPNASDVFIYSLPANFMAVALEDAAAASALATKTVNWTAEQVADAIAPIANAVSLGPIAIGALVILALIYLPKPRRS